MKYILGNSSVTVYMDGKPYTISNQAQTYNAVVRGLRENDEDAVRSAVNIRDSIVESLTKTAGSKVQIVDGQIMYGDREVTGLVASRIFTMLDMGLSVEPMVRFIENLMQNPSKRAVDELFGFLDACKLPITEDGHFLAYKRVREDYKDVHSGTMDNSIGQVLSMERNLVDEDKNNTCSYGLHFCSYDYLAHFGGARIVVVKINPADVVAIPADYNNSKGRTCKYEVVDEIPLNEYKMPEYTLAEDYTSEYSDDDEDGYDDYYDEDKDDFNEDNSFTHVPSANSSVKLTHTDVRNIREKWDYAVWDLSDIMNTYNISRRQAVRIIRREAWKDVV